MITLYEYAYAKLNLTLDVLDKRADGYHDIKSIMQTVSIRDDIEIDLGTGKPWKLILSVALPLMLGNVFQQMYTVVDTAVVGNVLGVTGLLGDGRSELFQTVFGAMGKKYEGQIYLEGKPIKPVNTHQALSAGIAYLPRNRKENAILKDMSILDNGSIVHLPKIRKNFFIDEVQQKALFEKQKEELQIKMGHMDDLITSLSGGNQQKVVLAKWLMAGPKVLILDNPTQGVDVGAKEEIYSIIHRLAQDGVAIVVLSSEAQEIIRICDRSIVLFHGRQTGLVEGDGMNERNIMYLATGGSQETKERV